MFEAAISSLLKEVTHSKPNIIFSFIQFVDRFQTAGLCIKYLTLAGDEDTPPGRLPNLAGSQDVNRAAWSRIASKISNLINVSLNLRCLRITHAERAMEACPSLHDVISQCKNLSELRLTDPTSSSSTIYTIRSIQSIRSPLRVLELKELHPTGYCLHPLTLLTNFVDTLEELYVYAKITSRWITVPEVWPKVSTGVISREPNILVAALEQAFPNLRELKVDGGAEIGDFSEYTRDNRTHIFSNWTELDHIQGVFTDIWHLGLRGVCVDSLSNENTPRGNRIAQYLPNIMEQTRPRKLNLTLSKYIWPSLNQGIQRLKTLVVSASWDNDPQAMFRSLEDLPDMIANAVSLELLDISFRLSEDPRLVENPEPETEPPFRLISSYFEICTALKYARVSWIEIGWTPRWVCAVNTRGIGQTLRAIRLATTQDLAHIAEYFG